jgi:thiamine pyrophosphate-dependent acetolactate synthase large subunit-like protein
MNAPFSNAPLTRDAAGLISRFDATQALVAKLHNHEAVIGGIGNTNFDLWATGRRPENFYMLGSMGLAVPIALGVAIAQPQRRVIALEGDGSILMQLGCLATVAARAPRNLLIVVMDNGTYQITGGQPTATGLGADIVGIARASGLTRAAWAADLTHFAALADQALTEDGPWLIATRNSAEKPREQTTRDPSQIRDHFMRGLGVRPAWEGGAGGATASRVA